MPTYFLHLVAVSRGHGSQPAPNDDLRFSLAFRNASFNALDLLSPEAGGCPLVLGSGEVRANWALQLRDWGAGRRLPLSSLGGHCDVMPQWKQDVSISLMQTYGNSERESEGNRDVGFWLRRGRTWRNNGPMRGTPSRASTVARCFGRPPSPKRAAAAHVRHGWPPR